MASCSNCNATFSGGMFDSTCPACRRLDRAVGKIRGNFVDRAIAQAKEDHAADVQQATLEASAAAAEAARETATAVKAQAAIAMKQANDAAARQARYDRSARLLFEAMSLVREIERARNDGSTAAVLLWVKLQTLAAQLPVLTPDNVEPSQRGELGGVFEALRAADATLQRDAAGHIALLDELAAFEVEAAKRQAAVAAAEKGANESLVALHRAPLSAPTQEMLNAEAQALDVAAAALVEESVEEQGRAAMPEAWAHWSAVVGSNMPYRQDVKLHTIRSAREELRDYLSDPPPVGELQRWADTLRFGWRQAELVLGASLLGLALMGLLRLMTAASKTSWIWVPTVAALGLLVPATLAIRARLVRKGREERVVPAIVAEQRAKELLARLPAARAALGALAAAKAEAQALNEAERTIALHALFSATPVLVEAHELRARS